MNRHWDKIFGSRETQQIVPAQQRRILACETCGENMRSDASQVCWHCGAPRTTWTLSFFNSADVTRATQILNALRIPHKHTFVSVPHHPQNVVMPSGMLQVPEASIRQTVEALEQHDVLFLDPMAVREYAQCPVCCRGCNPETDQACPHCGVPIRWIDLQEVLARRAAQRSAAPEIMLAVTLVTAVFFGIYYTLGLRAAMLLGFLVLPFAAVWIYVRIERSRKRRLALAREEASAQA